MTLTFYSLKSKNNNNEYKIKESNNNIAFTYFKVWINGINITLSESLLL